MRVRNTSKQVIGLCCPDHREVILAPGSTEEVPDGLLKALEGCQVTKARFRNGDLVSADDAEDEEARAKAEAEADAKEAAEKEKSAAEARAKAEAEASSKGKGKGGAK